MRIWLISFKVNNKIKSNLRNLEFRQINQKEYKLLIIRRKEQIPVKNQD